MSDREPVLAPDDDIRRSPAEAGPGHALVALLRVEVGVVVACTVLSTLLIAASLLALGSLAGAKAGVARVADAARIAVVLGSSVTPSDADALKARIAAIPGVAFDRAMQRQELLADIQRRRAMWNESLAIPEIWLFRVAGSGEATADGAVKAIGPLAGVDGVRWDADWARALDRSRSFVDEDLTLAVQGGLALAAVGLIAAHFLLGRALSAASSVIPSASTRVVAYITVGLCVLSELIAIGAIAWGASLLSNGTGERTSFVGLVTGSASIRLIEWNQVLAVCAAALILAFLGAVAGARRK